MASTDIGFSRLPLDRPPGPKGRLLVGSLLELGTDWLGFLSQCSREYGDVVFFRLAHVPIVLLTHPDHIEQVLVANAADFSKSRGYRALERIVGKGLLTSEGEQWRRQRKVIQPAFRHDCLVPYAAAMVGAADRVLQAWHDGDVRDIHGDMMRTTLDIVARTLLGCEASKEAKTVADALEVVAEKFLEQARLAFVLPARLPLPSRLSLKRAVRRLDEIIYEIIRRRRASGRSKEDLLDTLLQARDQEGCQLSDTQLRDELKTLFLAGHETTAIALSWTFYLLAQHPEIDAQLCEELEAVLGNRAPGFADVPRLRYTEMVIKESMRLYPPAWGMSRQAKQPFEVGGYQLAAGTTVFLVPWITHRDRRFFPEPERFDPFRWRDDPIRTGRIPRFAYFPFGGGPRVCVGAAFAMLEATLLLARIAQRFRFTTGQPAEIQATVTLRPKQGVRVVLHERRHAAAAAFERARV
jgi:cytochrome P450